MTRRYRVEDYDDEGSAIAIATIGAVDLVETVAVTRRLRVMGTAVDVPIAIIDSAGALTAVDGSAAVGPDLGALDGVDARYWEADGSDVVEMDAGEKTAVDAARLVAAKTDRYAEIDAKSRILISQGFVFSMIYTMSMSLEAQQNAVEMMASPTSFSYPFYIPTLDDMDQIEIDTEMGALYFGGELLARKRAILDGGIALKAAVRAAADEAEVAAVVDDRT